MFFCKHYLKHLIKKNNFKLLIVICSILLMSLLANIISAEEGKFTGSQKPKSLEQQINILKDKVDKMEKAGVTVNNNLTEQTSTILSISSNTVKYVGVVASFVLPLIILLIGYQVIRSYQFEQEFRNLRKLMTDEYDKILKIRSEADNFMSETKSKMTDLGDFIGDLATKYLMSKTSELIREEKKEREKVFEEVKTQVSEVKTTVEDEKARNIELMKKLESLDLTLTPTVYIERGSIYFEQRNFIKAIENYDEAIRLNKNEKSAYFNRGLAYLKMRNFNEAIKDFTKYTEIDPKSKEAFINLSICYRLNDEDDEALEKVNKAIKLDPNYAFAYYQKGLIYKRMAKYDLAINELNEALKISPNVADYLFSIGTNYGKMGDNKKAIQYYLKCIEIEKTSGVMMNLSEAYICDGNYTEAEKWANDCYSISSTIREKIFSKYLLLLALILNKKEYKLELKEFARTVQSSSDFKVGDWSFEEIFNCLEKGQTTIPVQAATLIKRIIGFLKEEIKEEELLF